MASHRGRLLIVCVFASALTHSANFAAAAGGTVGVARAMQEDAELTDVFFVDADSGWAVGDRGVIWHTDDGGRRWQLQSSGVDCRLESVHFIDAQRGWAAGGVTQPYLHTTRGVLLKTVNGGHKWARDEALVLPALRQVKLFSAAHGWALGAGSAVFPSGVFVTEDAGRTWLPIPSGTNGGWLTGDFLDPLTGAVAGRKSAMAAIRRRAIQPSTTPDLGIRSVKDMKLIGPTGGWLVGDGALMLTTNDLGRTWQLPAGDLPAAVNEHFDFHGLAVHGKHCWIAGSPGTRVLHTADGGATWQSYPTRQNLPIRSLHFADESRGWAVGALGTILHTLDGGRTWHRQRAGGARAAIYGIYADASAVPLELMARLSGNDGYLGRVHIIARRDIDAQRATTATLPERTDAALVSVGASGAETSWRFPARQSGLSLSAERLVEGFDAANDGAGLDRLEAELVRNIRLWRPDVVFTHGANPRGDEPLGHLVNQLVLRAIERAADPTRFPLLSTEVGLGPWQVKKVYATLSDGVQGAESLTTSQLATRLERSLAEQAAGARGLLSTQSRPVPAMLGFQLVANRLPQGIGRRGFLSGINLKPGGDARRALPELADRDLDKLRKMARRHRDLKAILSNAGEHPRSGARLLGQVADLTAGLKSENAGRVLFQLGRQYHQSGRWPMAAEVFELLARRYPDHQLTGPALVWLVRYFSSSEAAWRVDGGQRLTAGQTVATGSAISSRATLGQVLPAAGPRRPIRQRSTLALDSEAQLDRPAKAAAMAKILSRLHPTLLEEPSVRFPLAAADRRRGFTKQAEAYYLAVRSTRAEDAWWSCAAGERWLAEAQGAPPKRILHCVKAGAKPRLNGRLDDAVWQAARPVELKSRLRDDADWPAAAMLAYDDQFLYLAVQCRRATGASEATSEATRSRDADLSRQDRVEIYLDLDRDWTTTWKLTVDERGWTGESCWGDKTWNPTWFVAYGGDRNTWTVEAAIGLDQLTGDYPKPTTVWSVGVQRIVRGVGFQSWTTPAATTAIPEGFGYLIFD